MFFDILKHDIKRKKTMNIIVLLFVILAVTFISSSVNNLLAITNSLENFFDKSGVSDFITFEIGNSTPSAKEVAKNTDGVTEIKTEDCIFVTKCEFGQEEIKNSIIIDSLKNSIQTFFDQNNMEISQVNDGEIYVPQTILDDKKADIGDSITLTVNDISKTFTVKGVLKDAILGSRFVGVKRLLVSDSDYQSFEKTDKANLQKMEINFIKTNNSPALKKNLVVCDSILNADDRSLFYYTYVMEMIVAGVLLVVSVCLIVISLVILSFTVSFTLSEEFRQIGIMQAIGIPDRKIRFIYMVKYLAISVVGAVVGLILSFPFGNMLLLRVSGSIVMTYSNGALLGVLCAFVVVAAILLFCWVSTRRVKKFTPVDAIRNGSTGENYKKKRIIHFNAKPVRPVLFMAVNDVLSGIKHFLIMLLTFFVGISMIMVCLNVSSTLQSEKLLGWINMRECDAAIATTSSSNYMVPNGREKLKQEIEELESVLEEKGWKADCFTEVATNVILTKGDTKVKTTGIEGINTDTDRYAYIEGTAPQNKNEIAITRITAEKLNVNIGDTVTLQINDEEKDCMITAIYQTMMFMGDSIRLYPNQSYGFEKLVGLFGIQIDFSDNPSDSEIERRIQALEDIYPDDKIMTAAEYADDCVEGTGDVVQGVSNMILLVVILIDILVAVLMEKSFLTKERGEIAMLKAIGFKNSSIMVWQALRIGIIMLLAVLLSIIFANPIGQLTTSGIFKMMGAENIIFDTDILKTYVIYPIIVFTATVFSVFISALSIRNISSNEINSIE